MRSSEKKFYIKETIDFSNSSRAMMQLIIGPGHCMYTIISVTMVLQKSANLHKCGQSFAERLRISADDQSNVEQLVVIVIGVDFCLHDYLAAKSIIQTKQICCGTESFFVRSAIQVMFWCDSNFQRISRNIRVIWAINWTFEIKIQQQKWVS